LNRICRQASEDSSTCEIRADSSCAVAGASPFVRPGPGTSVISRRASGALFVDDAQPRDSSPGLPVEHQQRLLPFAVNPAIGPLQQRRHHRRQVLPIGVHRLLAETDAQKRREWIGTLDRVESLKPRIVIAKHKRPGNEDHPRIIEETRQYIRDFDRLVETAATARKLYDQMLILHPLRMNVNALWTSAFAFKE